LLININYEYHRYPREVISCFVCIPIVLGKYHVGQNLAKNTGSSKMTWDKILSLFYGEVAEFTYNSDSNDLNKVGHFTQV